MAKGEAYCEEVGRNLTIREARDLYFSLPEPRKKLTFFCGDPRCRAISKAEVIGANYHKLDDPAIKVVSPYYRENPYHAHIATCTWVSDGLPDDKQNQECGKRHNARTSAATAEVGLVFRPYTVNRKNKSTAEHPITGPEINSLRKISRDRPTMNSNEKPRRPETNRFIATVAMNHLRFSDSQRRNAFLEIKDVAIGTFYSICIPIKWFDPVHQSQRIYYGRCNVTSLNAVFLIKYWAKISSSMNSEKRIATEIKLNKSWLNSYNALLTEVLEQLAKTNDIAWCYFYSDCPPIEALVSDKQVARFEVSCVDHIAVIPDSELTESAPIEHVDE